ncbi:MAG: hypothetical protein QMD05_03665 [Candidatus Brocadiaceae bacterium]|nr:hypothetical protein [Candidatus Brocadiaceae bacterium]
MTSKWSFSEVSLYIGIGNPPQVDKLKIRRVLGGTCPYILDSAEGLG